MSTAVATAPAQPAQALAKSNGAQLPEAVTRRGINEAQWRTLSQSLFPGAKSESVLMVIDYCAARNLDPLKKPCHIVPINTKDAQGNWGWRDVVMPGIYEYRITAHRTGLYLGHTKAVYGPEIDFGGVKAPASCEMTMRRWHRESGQVVEFPVEVFFAEACGTDKEGKANQRWKKAPKQMLTKCTEAAGLREAFPEEFGGEQTVDEMEGSNDEPAPTVAMPTRISEQPIVAVDKHGAADTVTGEVIEDAPVPSEPEPPATVKLEPLPDGADRVVEFETKTAPNGKQYCRAVTERNIPIYSYDAALRTNVEGFFASKLPCVVAASPATGTSPFRNLISIAHFEPRDPGMEG